MNNKHLHERPKVDNDLWKGVKYALPYAILSWTVIIAIIVLIGNAIGWW